MAARKRRGARERREAKNLSASASSAEDTGQSESGLAKGKVKRAAKAKPAKAKAKAKPAKAKAKAKPARAKAKAKPARAKAKSKPARAKAKAKPARAKAKAKPDGAKPSKSKAARLAEEKARLGAEEKARAKARRAARARRRAKLEAERVAQEKKERTRERAKARARARAAKKKELALEAERRRLEKAKKERLRRLYEKRRAVFEAVFKREVQSGEIALPKRGVLSEKGGSVVTCHRVKLFRGDIPGRLDAETALVAKLMRELEKYAKERFCERGDKSKLKFWFSLDFLTYKKGNLRGDTVKTFKAPKVSREVALQHYQSSPSNKTTLKTRLKSLLSKIAAGPELLLFSICVGAMPPGETERERQRRMLEEVFVREKASGEIQLPRGSQITRNDNYGESFTISKAVHLTTPDVCEQLEDIVATCVSFADELNDYIRSLPEAIQAQSLPRFWTTYEFLVFDKARRRGSPKTFFLSTDKGKEEITLSYDGHPQVYFDEYEGTVRRMFQDVTSGPEILIYAIHVGGTFRGLKKKRRRRRGDRRRGRRGTRVARRVPMED